MRKIFIPLIAVFALCGCDNPEDFQHPENPKKEVITTTAVPNTTATTTTTTTDGTTPPAPAVPQDTSPAKSGEAQGVSGEFDKVNVSAALEAEITVGGASKVSVEASKNSFEKIKFEVKDTTLNIITDKDFRASTAKVSITVPTLVAVSCGQSALVKVYGVTGPNFACSAIDTSSIECTGAAENVDVSAAGGCLVQMKGLLAKTGTVTASGKSVIEVKCTDKIVANSSGESVITIAGLPRKMTKNRTEKSIINLAQER
ncbi:MAG: DUF2807 domain-containing protein [Candidatus Melainabacteria bacterium]|nr:DUF2807 domain-containing protein [Candidatus Melainabacteria bacterium]